VSIITVENLVKTYGSVRAVDGISFQVEEGSIFGFLGPNGAGKTTTISVLCTLLGPTSGRASINGHDCVRDAASVRKSIGLVFQDTTLDKDLTAYENLAFHAYLYRVPKSEVRPRVEDALRFMGLDDRKDDLVKRFSGGMKRRLEVARGLIHRPRVLFLDEPTLGLDPQSRANLWESILELPARHQVTVFMTTHYMDEAEVCDRIAVIDKGRIIAEGSPAELKKTVGGDVISLKTTDDEASRDILRRELELEAEIRDGELYLTTQAGDACIPRLISALADRVLSVRMQRPTLNDVFLHLTGKAIRDTDADQMDNIKSEVRAYRRRRG
jgi:ABC-2 type transport system ATP-binding protein